MLDLVPPSIAHYYQLVPWRARATAACGHASGTTPGVIAALREVTGLTIEPSFVRAVP